MREFREKDTQPAGIGCTALDRGLISQLRDFQFHKEVTRRDPGRSRKTLDPKTKFHAKRFRLAKIGLQMGAIARVLSFCRE